MENNFCQSCSMPLDNQQMLGSEKDGSPSHEYCKYCYQDGAFVHPEMSLQQMSEVVNTEMKKRKIPENIVKLALETLPHLKRWREELKKWREEESMKKSSEEIGKKTPAHVHLY